MHDRRILHVQSLVGGRWEVRIAGEDHPLSVHDKKSEALRRAREEARTEGLGEIIVHTRRGPMRTEYVYDGAGTHVRP